MLEKFERFLESIPLAGYVHVKSILSSQNPHQVDQLSASGLYLTL